MARIQNPQNEKGELFTTDNKVQELITKRLVPLEDSFKNISNDLKDVKDNISTGIGTGINVGRDINHDWKITEADETLNEVKKIEFFGEYVNIVTDENNPDSIKIYIGKNNNPAEFSTVTAPDGTGMYLYAAPNDEYSLGPVTAGSKYATCQTGGTEIVYAGTSDTFITIPNITSTVKVEAVDNSGGSIASCETAIIDGTSPTVTKEENGIKIEVYEIYKNTSDDAKNGMTPGFIHCKVKATLTNSTIMPQGGFYKVKMTVADNINTNETGIFIYTSPTAEPSIGEVTAKYISIDTKFVSGIKYDSSANITVNVNDIENTQWMATKNTNRITISDNSSRLTNIGDVAVGSLEATDKTVATAVYSLVDKVVEFSIDHTPAKMSGTYTVTPLRPVDGSQYTAGKKEASFVGERYLWNGVETPDTDAAAYFHTDGTRLAYEVLTDDSGNVTGLDLDKDGTYDSEKSLVDYSQQLLVQGGELKHPGGAGCDVTGTYNSVYCTGTRYWTKLIKTDVKSNDTHTVFTITGTNITDSDVKLWAVCANTDDNATAGQKAVLLSATSANGGVATNISANSITVEIRGGVMTCKKNSTFYLVVELPANSTTKLGAITVANG